MSFNSATVSILKYNVSKLFTPLNTSTYSSRHRLQELDAFILRSNSDSHTLGSVCGRYEMSRQIFNQLAVVCLFSQRALLPW